MRDATEFPKPHRVRVNILDCNYAKWDLDVFCDQFGLKLTLRFATRRCKNSNLVEKTGRTTVFKPLRDGLDSTASCELMAACIFSNFRTVTHHMTSVSEHTAPGCNYSRRLPPEQAANGSVMTPFEHSSYLLCQRGRFT